MEKKVEEAFGFFENYMKDATVSVFETQGELQPVILFMKEKNGKMGLEVISVNMDRKDEVAFILQRVRMAVPICALISESWMVKAKPGEPIDEKIPPSKHPNRIESVMLTLYCDTDVKCYTAEIVRPEGNKPFLMAWECVSHDAEISGRFIDAPAEWN